LDRVPPLHAVFAVITIGATGCSVSEIASARTRAGLAKWARRSD